MFAETNHAKIVTVMWVIWTSRNNLVHDKGSLDPAIFLKSVRESLVLLDIPVQHAKILPGHGWRLPEVGWVKIHTDAGISSEELKGGAGGIARDQSGFIGAWCKPYPGVTNPIIAEALSLRDGVIFAKLQGFSRGNRSGLLGGREPLGLARGFSISSCANSGKN
jgi:hypothetical protein